MKTRWLVLAVLFVGIVVVALTIYSQFPDRTSEIITGSLSAILTVSTVFYVFLTSELVSETRRIYELQTDPKVSVEVRPRNVMLGPTTTQELQLVIRNIGLGPAHDITLRKMSETRAETLASENGPNSLSVSLSKISEESIAFLAPDSEIRLLLWFVIHNYEDVLNGYSVMLGVEYYKYPERMRKPDSQPFNETYTIDFTQVMELMRYAASNVVTELQGIRAELTALRTQRR
ncbi:MAG: hypothetical protein ACXV3D_04535 [Halobacteriota archaeon]